MVTRHAVGLSFNELSCTNTVSCTQNTQYLLPDNVMFLILSLLSFPPVVFQFYPLSMGFETVTAVGLQSWVDCIYLIVSGSPDVLLYLSPSPCVSHSGYRCLTLWISLVTVLVTRFPFVCLRSGLQFPAFQMSLFTGLSFFVFQSGFRQLMVSGSADVSLQLFSLICFGSG